MLDFKAHGPYTTPVELLKPTITVVKGVRKKVYPLTGYKINCTVRTFGGTERVVNDVLVIDNTAVLETWYTPEITADCRFIINGVAYEVIGEPENVNMRNQYLIVKVKAIKGGA